MGGGPEGIALPLGKFDPHGGGLKPLAAPGVGPVLLLDMGGGPEGIALPLGKLDPYGGGLKL